MNKVGIDIGGTQLRCAIFDEGGQLIKKVKFNNEVALGCTANLDKLIDFINEEKTIINLMESELVVQVH